MEGSSPQVLWLDSAQQTEAPAPSHPKPPPAHLNAAARRAWADVVAAAKRLNDADDLTIELAAVLLAHLREDGVVASLAVRLNALLIELGLPPAARAEIQPEEALAVFSRKRRAQDAADVIGRS